MRRHSSCSAENVFHQCSQKTEHCRPPDSEAKDSLSYQQQDIDNYELITVKQVTLILIANLLSVKTMNSNRAQFNLSSISIHYHDHNYQPR